MLVLTREIGESIHIGSATVKVVRISPQRVRLGIIAPRRVRAMRSEVYTDGQPLDWIVDAARALADAVLDGRPAEAEARAVLAMLRESPEPVAT